jgi:hypothetical protein
MNISVTCASCGKSLEAKEEWAGKNVRCPGCRNMITVPGLKHGPPPLPAVVKAEPRRDRHDDDRPPRRDRYDDDRPPRRPRDDIDDLRGRHRDGQPYDIREIKLTKMSTGLFVVLLIFANIVPTIIMLMNHGNLPKVRDDDPSVAKAIGFLFIPFFNLYWAFFVWLRLIDRLNEAREVVGQEPDLPRGLMKNALIIQVISIPLVFCAGVGVLGLIAAGVMHLIAMAQIQGKVNEIMDVVDAA